MTRNTARLAPVVGLLATCVLPATLDATAAQEAALPPPMQPTGMVCTSGTVSGTGGAGDPITRTFNLTATSGYIATPDGNSVFMWSYDDNTTPPNFQSPGPVLCANQSETVRVNLTNNLPEPTSIMFPGQDSAVVASGGSPGLLTTE